MSAISIPRNQPDREDLGALAVFKPDPGVFVWAKTVGDPNVLTMFRPVPQMLVCSTPTTEDVDPPDGDEAATTARENKIKAINEHKLNKSQEKNGAQCSIESPCWLCANWGVLR